MKTSLRKLMSTFSDLGSVRDDKEDEPQSPSSRSEASSYKRGFTFTNAGKRKRDKKEIIKLLSDLSEERKKTLELQDRLQSILSANTEMRATAALQVDEERRMRRMAEARIREARIRMVKAEKALNHSEGEKSCLEAELMEAASDVLAHRAYRQAYQEKMEVERAAWNLLEQRDSERAELEKRLQASEAQRLNLLKSIVSMRQNAEALGEEESDLLEEVEKAEEEVSRSPSQNLAEEIAAQPNLKFGAPLTPIIEFEEDANEQDASYTLQGHPELATIHEEIPDGLPRMANGSPNGSANGSPKMMNGSPNGSLNGSPKMANGSYKTMEPPNYEDISFSPPISSAYPQSIFGSDVPKKVLPPLTPIKVSDFKASDWEEPVIADELMVSVSSDSSGDSILLTDRSGLITVGDFIVESEACQR